MKNTGSFFKRQGFYLALLGVVCAAGYMSVKGADRATDKASQIKLAQEGNRVNNDTADTVGDGKEKDSSDELLEVGSIDDEKDYMAGNGLGDNNDDKSDTVEADAQGKKDDADNPVGGRPENEGDILDNGDTKDEAGITGQSSEAEKTGNTGQNGESGRDGEAGITGQTGEAGESGHDLGVVNVSTIAYSFNQEEGIGWPLEGNIIMKFSDEAPVYYETVGSFMVNDGLVIAAKMGDEVKCGCDGVVTNIYTDDMYGNMIDISIGNDYTLTYGQVENISVNIGDDVKASQVIANVAAPSSFFSKEGDNVFISVRDQEGYIDPLFFLN